MYLVSYITPNREVEVRTCSDLFIYFEESFIKDSLGVIYLYLKFLNSYISKLTMGAVDPVKGPSSASIMCSGTLRLIPNDFRVSLPYIM